MREFLTRAILAVMVVASLGMAQVAGVSRGFWCQCTPSAAPVAEPTCESAACHDHDHEAEAEPESPQPGQTDHDHGQPPCQDRDHQHHEVRETLQTTTAGTNVPMPPPLVAELSASEIRLSLDRYLSPSLMRAAVSCRIRDGSPPAPLLVARTVVRLV